MKRLAKRIGALAAACLMVLMSAPITAQAAETGYTYTFDYWGDVQYSPDAYEVAGVFTSVELGLEKKLSSPQGMFVYKDYIYICDTGNNRILELERTDASELKLVREITEFTGAEVTTFSSPSDIAVSENHFFIADKNNGRVLKLTKDLQYVMEFTKPTDETFDQDLDFLPSKLAIDTADRVYCVGVNVNKGLIKFEANGEFAGFVGATPVTYNWTDYIWKKFATKEQRAQMTNFVPTEYDNLYMDYEGFIYACTSNVSEKDLDAGAIDPVRRLNMMGSDILIRNGNWPVYGDIHWGTAGGYTGPSLLIDITSFENDAYVALDKNRGRLFAYDDQGRLLFAFGGSGNMDGYFKMPSALEHMGYDLLVLDQQDCSLTIFTPSAYGSLIYQAIDLFQDGEYEASGDAWQKVINLNGNYDLAYIGIGRALLRQERYHEAMEYFELKLDDDNYSKAFKQYRKEWVEENIGPIVVILFVVIVVPLVIGKVKKIKYEIDTADIFQR
ncbi:MAG: hypothetical protein J6K04_11460 [Lachnospiraceae bacterium]|nr:hypothetical protein [Lachnospiraceae bacterium]